MLGHLGTKPSQRASSCQHLDFGPLKPNADSDLQNFKIINLCYFKPLSLWHALQHQKKTNTNTQLKAEPGPETGPARTTTQHLHLPHFNHTLLGPQDTTSPAAPWACPHRQQECSRSLGGWAPWLLSTSAESHAHSPCLPPQGTQWGPAPFRLPPRSPRWGCWGAPAPVKPERNNILQHMCTHL